MITIVTDAQCDKCKRIYRYISHNGEVKGLNMLQSVLDKDLCRQCLKDLIKLIE